MSAVDVVAIAEAIGEEVAGPASAEVDRCGRFPSESIAAFKRERLLSALVPEELGGFGASIPAMADAVRAVSHYCASSAMVLAMHSIEVFNLVHFGHTAWLRGLLGEVVDQQILLANATSERVGPDGGAALSRDESGALRIERPTVATSYGLEADAILTHVRRSPKAAEDDRVFLAVRADEAELVQTTGWNTLGLRGTCSYGLTVRSKVDEGSIFPEPWPTVMNGGAIQVRHVLAGAAYVGLAESALHAAHVAVRAEARRAVGTVPPNALRLAELHLEVEKGRALVQLAAERFDQLCAAGRLDDIGFIASLRNLKVASTSIAVEAGTKALQICGIPGIHRDAPVPIERVIRDAHAALVMFGNDGLLRDNSAALIARKSI